MLRMKRCEHCGRKPETEFRGWLALIIVLLTFGLAYIQVIKGGSETLLPPWAGVILGAVVTNYFMSRAGERMREMTQEIAEKSDSAQTDKSLSV
jgi:hypothetical protein